MNRHETNNLIRVNKIIARRLYNLGFDVGLCPSKANPESPWGLMSKFNKYNYDNSFDDLCSCFIWYNCNTELGKYPAFYVEKYTYIHFTFKDGSNPYYFRGSSVDCMNEIKRWAKNWIVEGGKSHCFELKQKRLL